MIDTSEEALEKIKTINVGIYEETDYHKFLQSADPERYSSMGIKMKYCLYHDIDYRVVMKDVQLLTRLREIENFFWNERLTCGKNVV